MLQLLAFLFLQLERAMLLLLYSLENFFMTQSCIKSGYDFPFDLIVTEVVWGSFLRSDALGVDKIGRWVSHGISSLLFVMKVTKGLLVLCEVFFVACTDCLVNQVM